MPSDTTQNRYGLAGIVVASVFAFLYSVLVVERLLLGIVAVILLLFLYLVWRLVRNRSGLAGIVVASVFAFLYCVLVVERLLLGIVAVILLLFLYLVWRLVRTLGGPEEA